MKDGSPDVPTSSDWLLDKVSENSVVGFDPHLFGYGLLFEFPSLSLLSKTF